MSPYVGGGFGCKGLLWPHVGARGGGGPARRAAGEAGPHARPDVHVRGLSLAHAPASSAGRHARRQADRDGAPRHLADLAPSTSSPSSPASLTPHALRLPERRTRATDMAHVNAGTPTLMRAPRRGARAVRARVGAWTSWPTRSASIRSSCGCATTPTSIPRRASPWSSKCAARVLPPGRGALRLGAATAGAALDARRRSARRLGHGDGDAIRYYRFPGVGPACACCADGRAVVQTGTQDLGGGTYTVMTQVAADALGLPADARPVRAGRLRICRRRP